jgi:hypothetical protein
METRDLTTEITAKTPKIAYNWSSRVSFMDYDLGHFDLETRVLEPLENPFGAKVLPM